MKVVIVDDGAMRKFYRMSETELSNLIDKMEGFGVEIDSEDEHEIPIVSETEVLNDFGSLGL